MYNKEEAQEAILEELYKGISLRAICRADGMPDRSTVTRWLDADEAFAAKYARAKEIGLDERAEKLAEDIEAEEDVQKAKLKFEYGRWYLSKLYPKRYGDKIQHANHEGGPLQVNVMRFADNNSSE